MAAAGECVSNCFVPQTLGVYCIYDVVLSHNLEQQQTWWIARQKNKTVLGTWDDEAFQVSLRDRWSVEDPLAIPLLHEMMPYYCIPQW